jgi:hypothetical protein
VLRRVAVDAYVIAVVLSGPDGVSLALTEDVAEESARRLIAAVAKARASQLIARKPPGQHSGVGSPFSALGP